MYQRGIASKKLHGKISYKVLIELKDGKYRYTFSDFVFHYYKQNRNYEMVSANKQKSLNDKKAPGWQNLWENHKSSTKSHVVKIESDLKQLMKAVSLSENSAVKTKVEDF